MQKGALVNSTKDTLRKLG